MTDEQYKSLSDKIEKLTQTFKDQSTELQNENFWMRAVIIFLLTFAITTAIISI